MLHLQEEDLVEGEPILTKDKITTDLQEQGHHQGPMKVQLNINVIGARNLDICGDNAFHSKTKYRKSELFTLIKT